jgi:hypothetical protein
MHTLSFSAPVRLYSTAKAAWHFVGLPANAATTLTRRAKGHTRGWGSIRVTAQIGTTRWETSVFPDSKDKTYLLPLKADVRRKENIGAGDVVSVTLTPHLPAVEKAFI